MIDDDIEIVNNQLVCNKDTLFNDFLLKEDD